MSNIPTFGLARPAVSSFRRIAQVTETSGWTDLGPVASIASTQQPPISRVIVQLQPFAGRIFLGYGEWDIGLDKCDLVAWNPGSDVFETVVSSVATDAFWTLRNVGNELWALVTDPAVGTDPDVVAVSGDGSRVIASADVAPWHLFDVCEWSGSIYLAGALRDGEMSRGCVWRSEDGGTQWQIALKLQDSERLYAIFTMDSKAYAVANNGRIWMTSDGVEWEWFAESLLPAGAECMRPVSAAGQIVFLGGWPAYGAQNAYAFNGQTISAVGDPRSILDIFSDSGLLLLLTSDGAMKQSNDLITWDTVSDSVPASARSLCVLADDLYVGTSDSHLWRLAQK